MSQLAKLKVIPTPAGTERDADDATRLRHLFAEAQQGLRRVVALGLFCFSIKERIPHGQFAAWLAANVPEITHRSVRVHMQLSQNVLEACGYQIGSALEICHSGEILLLPEGDVPTASRPLREKIFELIDGKSQRQLFLEFKTAHETESGTLQPQIGGKREIKHRKTPLEAVAESREEAEEIVRLAIYALGKVREGHTLALISNAMFNELDGARVDLTNQMRQIVQGRRSPHHD